MAVGVRGDVLSSRAAPRPSAVEAWILAARPKTLVAAVAPVLVGSGLAAFHGQLRPLPALAALLGAVLIQVATNFANDYYDFARGSDTHERVGPTRVTQAGLLEPRTVLVGTWVTLGLATLVGVYLVAVAGWPLLVVGLASLACALGYTAGPWPLAYHGLGDLFVLLFFGFVAVAGTYYAQTLDVTADALLAGAGVGALSTAILVVNNLRDIDTDARAGKHTMAVLLGRRGTQAEYALLVLVAMVVPVWGVAAYGWPEAALVASLVGLAAVRPLRRVLGFEHPRDLLPALGQTARLLALYGAALAVALAWGAP